jgi:hypothetical protein
MAFSSAGVDLVRTGDLLLPEFLGARQPGVMALDVFADLTDPRRILLPTASGADQADVCRVLAASRE